MNLQRVTPLAELRLALGGWLEDAKGWIKDVDSSDDGTVEDLIFTAVECVEHKIGRKLITQTWRLRLDSFVTLRLPFPPVQAVTGITYLDVAGHEQTLATSEWAAHGLGSSDPAWISPAKGKRWPSTWEFPSAVAVTFTVGYGDPPDVPAPLKHAVLEHVASLYAIRELAIVSSAAATTVPGGYADLIRPYKLSGPVRWL